MKSTFCFARQLATITFLGLALAFNSPAMSQTNTTSPEGVNRADYELVVRKAMNYLLEAGQDREDGSFSKNLGPAVTGLCVVGLIEHGMAPDHPRIAQALKYVESFAQPDGGIYSPDKSLHNYETSVAIFCFSAANTNGKYDERIKQAVAFLKKLQWDDEEGHDANSNFYGGQGYGTSKRPDLSNTGFFIEALHTAGEDMSSTNMQRALVFLSRTQNLPGPNNTADYAAKTTAEDRGGFIYSPVGAGESKAGESTSGGLRSYASMTYSGLKSFLYAGVGKDDTRVKAAFDWIRRNYDVTTNPGMDQQGLFYYYHIFAKALSANGERLLVDAKGQSHNWRADLVAELKKRQRDDGSWTNEADRWYEGDPNLVTAYVLNALAYCHPDQDK